VRHIIWLLVTLSIGLATANVAQTGGAAEQLSLRPSWRLGTAALIKEELVQAASKKLQERHAQGLAEQKRNQ
jgi:hypothetical protein